MKLLMKLLAGMTQDKKVSDIMTTSMVMMHAGAMLADAAERMEREAVSSLLLEERGVPIGILTERDIMRALGQGMVLETTVDTLMTRGLISVSVDETVHAAFHLMVVNAIRHLVVVNGQGSVVGILSESDFRKYRGVESNVAALDVGSAMSQSYVGVTVESSLQDAALQMQAQKASCAVVLQNKRPIGIVTERDMVRLYRASAGNQKMCEVMTTPVATTGQQQFLVDAVRQMQQQKLRRLAVVADDGTLQGVLNEHDVVRHLEDEYVQMLQELVMLQAHELNENKYFAVLNQLPYRILVKDVHSKYVSCNESFAKEFNIPPHEIAGKSDFDFFPNELAEKFREDDRKVIEEAVTLEQEERLVKEEREFWIHKTKAPIRDKTGGIIGIVVMYHDITEQKHERYRLERDAWTMAVVNAANRALLFSAEEQQLLQGICDAITLEDRYVLAWVGWAKKDPERSIDIVASAGSGRGYMENIRVGWGDDELGNGPTGRSIRSGRATVNRNTHDNLSFLPWLERAEKFHIRSSLSIPFRLDDENAGVLTIYAHEFDAFHETEVKLFESLADNLGYGLHSRRMAQAYKSEMKERVSLASKLEASLEGALIAISATLEQRDPYTAGHQQHVAELAILIGKEMGLDEARLKGLYLASIVHDIGKIQIPSEILTKPGRLIPAEFALIKRHPEAGYNILKNITFPWPIADIVRQHHEYLDGSGYPLGLHGEDILLESRILTVADIVESMSADRPYRPAVGLDLAMLEIGRLSLTKLDIRVVDACVEVLKRGVFTPSELSLGE